MLTVLTIQVKRTSDSTAEDLTGSEEVRTQNTAIIHPRSATRQSILYVSHIAQVIVVNRLKPTGHVMHQQFNIQPLYALPTLYLCVLYLSENKQRLVPLTA